MSGSEQISVLLSFFTNLRILGYKILKSLEEKDVRDIDVSELRPYSESFHPHFGLQKPIRLVYQKYKSNLSQLIITSIFATRYWINIPIYIEEFSNENFDYFGITDKTLCPLCK
ncbi:hypothetical protein RIR_jg18828.t1 [Rhizophagus irregularis DAOM 181602=DAOM 197198]|nr:hypothetical protein RIR_jg18828.t1 [Rhizophagus irregularis DAOM 181602=DAOM 197198]